MMKNLNKFFVLFLLLSLNLFLVESSVNAQVADLPTGVVDGINYIDENTVTLVLLAPGKGSADVTGTFNNWGYSRMNKTPDGKRFWIQINGLTAGQEYIYQYVVDGSIRISDPFAEKILDPWNDHLIPDANYPGLIEWNDTSKGLASVFQTAQPEYDWQVENFQGPLKHHLLTYELLVRDFSEERSFQGIIDSIKYLKKLGVNAIELCPVNEVEGMPVWGYRPTHYFAIEKTYGPKEKLKELIDVAHQNGMAVIIDAVYNHSWGQSPLVSLYWNANQNRPAWDNPWYNEVAPYDPPEMLYGYDFNHESQYTVDFFNRVNKFWLEEYKVDGFRLDLTKGFTQKQTSGWNELEQYDQSRVNIIRNMANNIWSNKSNAYVILEHWCPSENDALTSSGMLIWNKLHGEGADLAMGQNLYEASLGAAQTDIFKTFTGSHDEERIAYMIKTDGNSSGGYNTRNLSTMTDRVELLAAFFYSIPGPKMLWMFEEQACDYSIFRCENGSNNNSCKQDIKPVYWSSYMQDPNRQDVYNTYSEILNLRKNNEVFTLGYFEIDENGDGIANNGLGSFRQIRLKHESMDVVLIGNFGVNGGNIKPWFTSNGTWYNYFNEEYPTYEYTGQDSYYLAPGQWELFTSEPIADPFNAPSNLATSVSNDTVSLSWIDNTTNETGFQIERSATSSTSGFTYLETVGVDNISFADVVPEDGKYYYRIQALGENGKTSDYSNVAQAQVGEIEGINIHYKNINNWSNVNIYVFNWDTKEAIAGWEWPGVPMTQEGDSPWYKFTISEDVTPGIVFNDGGSNQTDDLTRTTDGWYDGQWHDVCPGDCPIPPVPVLTVNPTGKTFTGSITVNLSATEGGVITYTLDDSDPIEFGTALSGNSLTFTETVVLRAIAENDNGYSNEIRETYTYDPNVCDTIYFYNENSWSTVNIYTWDTVSGYEPVGAWPGTGMTRMGTSNWYYWENCYNGDLGIVFNDGSGQQTDDQFSNSGYYYYGSWYTDCPGNCPGDTQGLVLHYKNSYNWSSPHIYFWNTSPVSLTTNWPGEPMVAEGDGWFKYTLEGVECANVIFSDNGNNQTPDLNAICKESWYDNGWVKSSSLKDATSFNNEEKDLLLQPYPNPFSNEINITISEANLDLNIQFYDINGRVVYSENINSGNGNITLLPDVKKGIYFMKVTSPEETQTFRIVKR